VKKIKESKIFCKEIIKLRVIFIVEKC